MDYKDTVKIMLDHGLIKKQKVDFSHTEALLLRAQKDIVAARIKTRGRHHLSYLNK